MAMLSVQWSHGQQMALLVGAVVYVLLVIAVHRITGAEGRWREERRRRAAFVLREIVDVERRIKVARERLDAGREFGRRWLCLNDRLRLCEEVRRLEYRLKWLKKKEAEYGNVEAEED